MSTTKPMEEQQQQKKKQPPSQSIQVLRRFVGGTFGGVLQALCAHPFDTIKGRMQQGLTPSMSQGVSQLMREEGIRGFYRGVTPPLIVNGTYNAVLFGVNQFMTILVTPEGHKQGESLSMWRVALAANLTAPFSIAVITPMEVIKVRMQIQPKGEGQLYSSPWDCARKIARREGMSVFGRGFMATLGSRWVGLPWYFIGYEWAKRNLSEGLDPLEPAPTYIAPCAGAVAGVSFWSACYPFDYTKTRVQASSGKTGMEIAKEVFATSGVRGFYKGFTPCICRAVPANASVWLGMDKTINFMDRNGW